MSYTPFLGKFPKIKYKPDNSIYGPTENVTDIFFRIGMVQKTIQNASSFYLYLVNEGDTPEILAEKVYGDPGAYWMILYANYLFDPQFDWPLNNDEFSKYVAEKYRPDVRKAVLGRVVINNPGSGYTNGFATIYDGYGEGARVSIDVDPIDGSIQHANVVLSGAGYYMNDVVTIDVEGLGGIGADFTVVMQPPADEDVLFYARTTDHHYEKIVSRISKDNDQPQISRFIVSKDQLTNGVIYIANTIGTFSNGEMAYVGDGAPGGDNSNTVFKGLVTEWVVVSTNEEANTTTGWLTMRNTKGDFIPYTNIKGNTSAANGEIIHTSFNDTTFNDRKVPFDYYNNLAESGDYETYNDADYPGWTMREVVRRFAISIYDYESELNEKKKLIKIIKPNYYQTIQIELAGLLEKYNSDKALPVYSYKRRLF